MSKSKPTDNLTEDVSKQKFCLMSWANPTGPTRCVNIECMAWRWSATTRDSSEILGYCGLAGKPEYR